MPDSQESLLLHDDEDDRIAVRDGSLDFHGSPASRFATGGLRSTIPVLLLTALGSASLFGVTYNLVLFMVAELRISNAAAAAHASIWTAAHNLSPLLVAATADAILGRFRAILVFSPIFVLGLALLALATTLLLQRWLFFAALYVIALGKGMGAPLLAFGADQFDPLDQREAAAKSSFFNLNQVSISLGLLVAVVGLVFVSDRLGFGAAIALCAGCKIAGFLAFCAGIKIYRYRAHPKLQEDHGDHAPGILVASSLAPILAVCVGSLPYETMRAQTFSLFVEQAAQMETRVGSFRIPPASLNCFDPISVLLWTALYDRALVPGMRRATGNPRGFSAFQRMGVGLLMATVAMASAAVVESRRRGGEISSVLWQIPQFALVGGSRVFYEVGLVEFLYDGAPRELRTMSAAMGFVSAGLGSFLSGILVSVVSRITGERGWIPRDLNQGHLDRFFWLLFALGIGNWVFVVGCAYVIRIKQ